MKQNQSVQTSNSTCQLITQLKITKQCWNTGHWITKGGMTLTYSGHNYWPQRPSNARRLIGPKIMALFTENFTQQLSVFRVYLALIQSVLLHASETWTLTVADSKSLDTFHMKCQRHILGISWHQFVRNEDVVALTGLSSLSDIICRRRSAIFGHIARLGEEVSAHKALHNCISLSLGRLPDLSWKRHPGRPRGRWIVRRCDQKKNKR